MINQESIEGSSVGTANKPSAQTRQSDKTEKEKQREEQLKKMYPHLFVPDTDKPPTPKLRETPNIEPPISDLADIQKNLMEKLQKYFGTPFDIDN